MQFQIPGDLSRDDDLSSENNLRQMLELFESTKECPAECPSKDANGNLMQNWTSNVKVWAFPWLHKVDLYRQMTILRTWKGESVPPFNISACIIICCRILGQNSSEIFRYPKSQTADPRTDVLINRDWLASIRDTLQSIPHSFVNKNVSKIGELMETYRLQSEATFLFRFARTTFLHRTYICIYHSATPWAWWDRACPALSQVWQLGLHGHSAKIKW